MLPGARRGKTTGARGQYKKGDWMWILAMGMTLGALATLASNGWMGRLASGFISTSIFLMVAYIVVRVARIKMSEIGNFATTIITALIFWGSDKFIYPTVFQPILGQLVPLETIQIGGISYVTATPALVIWIPVLMIGLLMLFEGGFNKKNATVPPLLTEVLAIGVGMLSFTTIMAGISTLLGFAWNLNAEWALPPLTPLTSLSWLLGFLYLPIAFGLWFKVKVSLWAYLVLQLLGVGASIWTGNWLGLVFNALIIVYLLAVKGSYKASASKLLPDL